MEPNSLDFSLSDQLEIHFDVPENRISAKTLSHVASGLQEMTDAILSDSLKEGDKAEVYLLIPKKGCYQAVFTVVISAITLATTVLATSFINTLVKRLLGKDLKEIGTKLGDHLIDEIEKDILAQAVITSIHQILATPTSEMEGNIAEDAYEKQCQQLQVGKNHIYEAIMEDESIEMISFDGSTYIQHTDFLDYIGEVNVVEESEPVQVGLYQGKIKILSPVSLREKSKRRWSCVFLSKDENHGEISFEIDDENFKRYVIQYGLTLAADDLANVQMIRNSTDKPQWRLVRVLEYGGKKISNPLSDQELTTLSGAPLYKKEDKQANMLDGFDT